MANIISELIDLGKKILSGATLSTDDIMKQIVIGTTSTLSFAAAVPLIIGGITGAIKGVQGAM